MLVKFIINVIQSVKKNGLDIAKLFMNNVDKKVRRYVRIFWERKLSSQMKQI